MNCKRAISQFAFSKSSPNRARSSYYRRRCGPGRQPSSRVGSVQSWNALNELARASRPKVDYVRSCPREFPDAQRILAQEQFAILAGVKLECRIHERQFFIHRQFPARPRVAGPPDQLLPAKFFVNGFEERPRVAV